MSFAVSLRDGAMEWAGDSLRTLFAQSAISCAPHSTRCGSTFFASTSGRARICAREPSARTAFGAYLDRRGFGESFRNNYLVPMGSAIWSMSPAEMLAFPALTFLRFFENHHLLVGFETPAWRTVTGGSRTYVDQIAFRLGGRIRLGTAAVRIAREADAVRSPTAAARPSISITSSSPATAIRPFASSLTRAPTSARSFPRSATRPIWPCFTAMSR